MQYSKSLVIPAIAFFTAILLLHCRAANAAMRNSPFPFPVDAVEGAGIFVSGDNITITAIHGTAAQLTPGNTYEIQGKYRLISNPQATLIADVVAPNGNAPLLAGQQSVNLKQGDGDFTLLLPFTFAGQPRIRLTSADSGSDGFSSVQLIAGKFPYSIDFKNDAAHFSTGDSIAVSEIRCSSSAVRPGSTLQIKGIFNLTSAAQARLASAMSETPPQNQADSNDFVNIQQGRGSFTLVLPIAAAGKLHLAFWPSGNGEALGSLTIQTGKSKLGAPAHPTAISVMQ